ncbi:hypothetical protein BGX27_003848, partial [Mortierella sp. AM989]
MKLFAAVVALVAASIANAQTIWVNCATAPDMTVTSFSLTYPPCAGKLGCFTATGVLSVPITAPATLPIVGKYLGQIVYTDHHDFCALLAASGQFCPVPVTVTSITFCVLIKSSVLVGIPFVLTISPTNGSGNNLFCQH